MGNADEVVILTEDSLNIANIRKALIENFSGESKAIFLLKGMQMSIACLEVSGKVVKFTCGEDPCRLTANDCADMYAIALSKHIENIPS